MMRRRYALLLLPLAGLLVAQTPSRRPTDGVPTIREAERELAAANARAETLERAAAKVAGTLNRLRAEQRAALGSLEAAEAQVTLSDLRFERSRQMARAAQQRLDDARRPTAQLLAGLAVMGRRPPLVAIADRASLDDLVRTRILLQATLPVIRSRTSKLAAEVERSRAALDRARTASRDVDRSRRALADRRDSFVALELRASEAAAAAGGAALSAGDQAIVAAEALERLRSSSARSTSVRDFAQEFAAGPAIPGRPGAVGEAPLRTPFRYMLPASADVLQGLGAIDDNGVRARGLTLGTSRGTVIAAPGSGVIRHSGPVEDFDGVVVIDHGRGWLTLMVNVGSSLKVGQRVTIGEPVGRALGAISVELSHNGQRQSPALIAGSSAPLSKAPEGG